MASDSFILLWVYPHGDIIGSTLVVWERLNSKEEQKQ